MFTDYRLPGSLVTNQTKKDTKGENYNSTLFRYKKAQPKIRVLGTVQNQGQGGRKT